MANMTLSGWNTSTGDLVRKTIFVFVSVLFAGSFLAPAATATAAGECEFTNTFCAWDQTGFLGERFTVKALPPNSGLCVNLVAHGWGDRIKSAINTNPRTASLFASDNCTGRPFPVDGNSRVPSISFAAKSVYVYQ